MIGGVVTLFALKSAWACSGPGAAAAIGRAELLGWLLFGISALLCLGAVILPKVRRAGPRVFWPLLIPLMIHPGWWMSARSGDCGSMRTLGAIVVTVLAVVAIGFVIWRAARTAHANE